MRNFLQGARLPLGIVFAILQVASLAPRSFADCRPGEVLQDIKAARSLEEDLNAADRLAAQGKREEARKIYEAAAARAQIEKNVGFEARALTSIGALLSSAAKYAEAQKYLAQALPLAEAAGDGAAVARVCNSLGIAAEYSGKSDDAKAWYKRAAETAASAGELRLQSNSLINLASLLGGVDPNAEAVFRDATELGHKIGAKELEARALHRWGDFLFTRGDFAAAMGKLERAAELYGEAGNRNDLARVYTSMGRLNRAHGRPADAIPFYEKALDIQKATGDQIGVIQSLNAMGVAYEVQEDYTRAGQYVEKAYELALKTESPLAIDFMRANLAGNLIERGQYARAIPLLEEVLRRNVEPNPANRNVQLSRAYAMLGQLPAAREHADKAVELSATNVFFMPWAFLERANVRLRQDDLSGALDDAQEAIRVIEKVRAKLVPMDFMKQGFSAQFQDSYSFLVGLYQRLGRPEKALEVAELSRSRAFLDLLATKEVRLKASDESEVALLRRVDEKLRAQGIDPAQAGSSVVDSSKTVKQTDEAVSLLQTWKSARPELQSFVAAAPQTAAQIIATAARLRSTLVIYWVGSDAVYSWVVPPDGKMALRRTPVSEKRLTAMITAASAAASKQERRELYGLLIRPIKQLLPAPGHRLTIIPHGPLMRLSFAALADDQGRYLLEDYPLHYAPAAALLEFTAAKKQQKEGGRRFLLVADPALPPVVKGEDPLSPLPGARAEVRNIARLLPSKAVTILQGPQADKQAVTGFMARASVIHFATHGVAQDSEPLNSYLVLSGGHSAAEARLTASEVYGFDLHADLVVLSSCRSGGGKLTGEGIASFARAFFYAGAPSLVVSLWNVADEAANRLLPDFYNYWLRGRDKIDALREAQLRLLADLRAGRVIVRTPAGNMVLPEDPILWAGFILFGEP